MQNDWGSLLQTLESDGGFVTAVAFSPDNKLVASAASDSVRLFDSTTGALLQELRGDDDDISALAFSRDNKMMAASSLENTIRIWDPATGASTQSA